MIRSAVQILAPWARRSLLAVVVLFAACSSEGTEPTTAVGIDREAFISTYVDLRTATIRSENFELGDRERATILSRHGVSEEDLMVFVEIHGEDIPYMREVWDEVEARLDAIRVLPGVDERR